MEGEVGVTLGDVLPKVQQPASVVYIESQSQLPDVLLTKLSLCRRACEEFEGHPQRTSFPSVREPYPHLYVHSRFPCKVLFPLNVNSTVRQEGLAAVARFCLGPRTYQKAPLVGGMNVEGPVSSAV